MVGPSQDWPTEQGQRASVVAQFGATRADLAQWALTTGDPLADAVVEEIHADGTSVRRALAQGIEHGLASLDDPPPAVAALLTDVERPPAGVDEDLIDAGCRPFFSVPTFLHVISLSGGALIRVYDSPSISAVLTTTGRLVDGVQRRLEETGTWVNATMLPGSLRPGGYGYTTTLQVRMLHAHMRRFSRGRGYDESQFGTAINQIDLARTWMDFTLTSYRAEAAMGFDRTASEMATVYRYWWHIAHLMGVDARLVAGVEDHEAAQRVDDLLQAVTGPPGPGSVELAHATLGAIADQLHALMKLPTAIGRPALFALTRRFHGHALADDLALPRPALDPLLTPAIAVIRRHRAKLRRDAAGWAAIHEQGIAEARGLIDQQRGSTSFEAGTEGPRPT